MPFCGVVHAPSGTRAAASSPPRHLSVDMAVGSKYFGFADQFLLVDLLVLKDEKDLEIEFSQGKMRAQEMLRLVLSCLSCHPHQRDAIGDPHWGRWAGAFALTRHWLTTLLEPITQFFGFSA